MLELERRCVMTSMAPDHGFAARGDTNWTTVFRLTEMWASLAIVTMWLAVLFDAIFGPDIVNESGGPAGTVSHVPSAVAVALFAFLATAVLAKYAFGRSRSQS
jgi:hypothetical protein